MQSLSFILVLVVGLSAVSAHVLGGIDHFAQNLYGSDIFGLNFSGGGNGLYGRPLGYHSYPNGGFYGRPVGYNGYQNRGFFGRMFNGYPSRRYFGGFGLNGGFYGNRRSKCSEHL